MVNAEHPDYDASDLFGPDDLPQPVGSGDGIVFDSIIGVPFVVDEIDFRASTMKDAKEGSEFAVISARALADVQRVETNEGEKIDLAYGQAFSTKSGSWRVVKLLHAIAGRNAYGKAVVRYSRVAGDTTKKARMLEVADKDEAAALLANLS